MLFIFLISFLQTCFIPGYILLLLLKRKDNLANYLLTPVFAFGLSLVINYLVVSLLAYFHQYTRLSLSIFLGIEFIILIYLLVKQRSHHSTIGFKNAIRQIKDEIHVLACNKKPLYKSAEIVFFGLSSIMLLYLLIVMIFNTGKIFSTWDAVFSWNRWAIDFFNNQFPPNTYHYPQLVPANWSISYVMAGYPFQFVPKAIMPLFLILPAYGLIILGLIKRMHYLAYSVMFLILAMYWLHWADGFADVPAAFFAIMVFLCLLLLDFTDTAENIKYILLGAFFSCGAAITKQAGLYIVMMYPVLLIIFSFRMTRMSYKRIAGFIFLYLIMIVTIILPYYLYAEYAIRNGTSESEIRWVTNEIYNGASFLQRFINACRLFSNVFASRILFAITLILFLFSFKDRLLSRLNIIFLLPFAAIWAFFYSYDLRNAAIIIPSFCFGIGYGIDFIIRKFNKAPEKI